MTAASRLQRSRRQKRGLTPLVESISLRHEKSRLSVHPRKKEGSHRSDPWKGYTSRSPPNASGGRSLWWKPSSQNAPQTNFKRPGAVWVHHPVFLQSVKRIDRYGLNRSACRAFKILKLYYEKLTVCSGTPLAHYDAATNRPIDRRLAPAIAQNRCRERTLRQRQEKRN